MCQPSFTPGGLPQKVYPMLAAPFHCLIALNKTLRQMDINRRLIILPTPLTWKVKILDLIIVMRGIENNCQYITDDGK